MANVSAENDNISVAALAATDVKRILVKMIENLFLESQMYEMIGYYTAKFGEICFYRHMKNGFPERSQSKASW